MKFSGWAVLACLLASGSANAADKITLILDWFVNADHAALFAAQYCGAYQEAGLEVRFVAPADPDSPPRLVGAGQADLAVAYQTQLNVLDDHGLGLVRVGTLIDNPLNTVMALGDSGIRSIADLKGKRIGATVGGVEDALLSAMLASAGLRLSDVTLVRVNFQMLAALMSRRLDAVIGAFRNYELIEARDMGQAPLAFLPEQHGVPAYDELILVAAQARARDPLIARFLAALRKGTACLLARPDAMWVAFAKEHPELDNALNREAWRATLPFIAKDPAYLNVERYRAFQAFLMKAGVITRALQTGDFAVQVLQ
jgi:putative hydroxymethylpyrimidine transport system substrate-binding protein